MSIGSGFGPSFTPGRSKNTASGPAARPVKAGLAAMPPAKEGPADGSKLDAQLRAAAGLAIHESRTDAALSSWSGKSEKLVALVGTARECSEPLAELTASFSRYFDAPDGKVPARIQKLSTAVAAYVARPENNKDKALVEDALRDALGGARLLNSLDLEYSSGRPKGPREAKAFFSRSDVKAATQLRDGQINPYIFGRGDGNMIGVVDRARAVLQSSPDQNRLTRLKQEVQFPQFIQKWNATTRDFEPVNEYQRMCDFDKNDLGIQLPHQNAYTNLGVTSDVDIAALKIVMDAHVDSGFKEAEKKGELSKVRNAVFQLQTPEGKAEYDKYLEAKADPVKRATLEATVVTEAQALLLGSKPNGMRMNALLHTIIQRLRA